MDPNYKAVFLILPDNISKTIKFLLILKIQFILKQINGFICNRVWTENTFSLKLQNQFLLEIKIERA